MSDLPDPKEQGDPLYAEEVNRIVEAVKTSLNTRGGRRFTTRMGPGGIIISEAPYLDSGIPAQWVWVKNTGTERLDPFRPAGILGQIYTAADDSEDDIITRCILTVINPIESAIDFSGHYVICAEHIDPGDIGRAWDTGVCPAWAVSNEAAPAQGQSLVEYTYAELLPQEDAQGNPDLGFDYLTCAAGGTSRIIWKKFSSIPTEQLIMVRLGFASVLSEPSEIVVIKITSKVNFNTYLCDEYEDGIDTAATDSGVTLRVLQIGADETIPNGTYFPTFLLKWSGVPQRTINVARDY